jgi:hypothetical protein
VLVNIFLRVSANTGSIAVRSLKRQGVQFVIAHSADRAACVDHGLDDLERLCNSGTSIDQIADKDRFATR